MGGHEKFVTDIHIRFRDVDTGGHVNNVVYLTYFEEGRKDFVRSLFGIVNPEDYDFILAHISCDFLKPIRISDTVCVEVWVGEIGRKHFDFIYRLVGKDKDHSEPVVYAKGRSVQVSFDYKRNTTISIPGHVRKKLSAYAIEGMESDETAG